MLIKYDGFRCEVYDKYNVTMKVLLMAVISWRVYISLVFQYCTILRTFKKLRASETQTLRHAKYDIGRAEALNCISSDYAHEHTMSEGTRRLVCMRQ